MDDKILKARRFVVEVSELAKSYGLNYFVVTDGASGISNVDNPAVANARKCHEEWELANGIDPEEEWELANGIDPERGIKYSS